MPRHWKQEAVWKIKNCRFFFLLRRMHSMSLSMLTTTQFAPYWINISSLQWILSKVIQIAFSGCLNSLNARMCKSVGSTINQKLLRDRIMHPCIILLWQQAVLFREWEGGKYRKNFGNARSLPSTHVMKKENNAKKKCVKD